MTLKTYISGFATAAFLFYLPAERPLEVTDKFYVCGTSKVYHVKKSCSALKRCTHTIKEYSTKPSGKSVCRMKNGCNGG